ncbi:MAG TPA: HEAT repeat domain-containing protein [Kofleriaceae bacterium]
MRRAAILFALVACGTRPGPTPAGGPPVPRLLAPPLIDPDARGAAYLTAVALQLQPAWHQFLEDCRLRLPASHALNRMELVSIAALELGTRGELIELKIAKSGNVDFDHAIEQVVRDAAPLPAPPRELWSDDDHVHLAWTFARDRRQAGPATARVVDVELPLRTVVDRRIGEHDLARAARRILRDKPSGERELATQQLMIATLREALASSDGTARHAAVEAIGRVRASELAMEVRQLLAARNDVDVRLAAINTVVQLGDKDAAAPLVEQLRVDLREQPQLALAGVRALVAIGQLDQVKQLLATQLRAAPSQVAMQALAAAPVPELAPLLANWSRSPNARTRAAVCAALAGYPPADAAPLLERGLRDRDAKVRATCSASSATRLHAPTLSPATKKRLLELTRDRDSTVRASALVAVAQADSARLPSALTDAASDVRAAYAKALAVARPAAVDRELRALIEDRDPDVRAAAWTGFAALAQGRPGRGDAATRAAADPAPQVRLAALPAIENDEILERLARLDDTRDVRTAALVELARRRGRAAAADGLLERLADATPGSAERVRTALAWLVAR